MKKSVKYLIKTVPTIFMIICFINNITFGGAMWGIPEPGPLETMWETINIASIFAISFFVFLFVLILIVFALKNRGRASSKTQRTVTWIIVALIAISSLICLISDIFYKRYRWTGL